eukprot:Skav232526  [mRNA]  locus=scaffold319:18029:25437:+ [translate_table: standard]
MKTSCFAGWAALVAVIAAAAILHFTVLCEADECNLPWLVNMLVSNRQLLLYHYRLRSYEEFLTLRTSGGYDHMFNSHQHLPIWALKGNQSKADVVKRCTVFDSSAHRFLPELQRMSRMMQRRQVHPSGPHCISGYLKPGEVECRSFFLTGFVRLSRGEVAYADEWLNLHLALGVDHFVVKCNDTCVEDGAVLGKYIEAGLVELRPPGPPECQPECMASLVNVSTFWLLYHDIDEFLLPPRGIANHKEYLLPFTSFTSARNVKQIKVLAKEFGSSGWKQRPPMPVIEAYVYCRRLLCVNGKSLALRDALDPTVNQLFPHRFTLLERFAEDTAHWVLNFGNFMLWADSQHNLVISSPANRREQPIVGGVVFFPAMYGTLFLLCLCLFGRRYFPKFFGSKKTMSE